MGKDTIIREIDEEKIKKAVCLFLEGIGEECEREGLIETPDRVAHMCGELFSGMGKDADQYLMKTFSAGGGGMVVEKDIRFYSVCEHHLLPFFGYAHIGYVPCGKVTGLSKLARCVDTYARRLQIQENLTNEIMEGVDRVIKPKGVIVMLEAEHMCMSMRGVKEGSVKTVTLAKSGCFDKDPSLVQEFYQMVGR